jgi:membrane protein
MKLSPSTFFSLLKQTFKGWQKDNATVWCAALAYFTIFSLGPLLLIVISITGLVFSKTSAENNIYTQIQALLGSGGANMIETIIHHAKKPTAGIYGTVIGTITLMLGAVGMFGQLQQMLNTIWGVTQKPKSGMIGLVKSRLLNFSMIGVIAFLLLVSLVASTVIAGVGTYLGRLLPFSSIILEICNFLLSFIIISILFAFILKVLPDVEIKWKNTWVGAVVTSLLFTIGKAVIGIYIGHSGLSSEYGAAASLVILLLWVYYSSQILFFGAEFTKFYTLWQGYTIVPSQYSVLSRIETTEKTNNKRINKGEKVAAKLARGLTEGVIEEVVKNTAMKKGKDPKE